VSPPREHKKSQKHVSFSPTREEMLSSSSNKIFEDSKASSVLDNSKLLHVKELYYDGASFIGDKIGNARNGSGEMLYPNGSKYNGDFKDNKRSGYGILTLANGEEEYNGDWQNDAYHGTGLLLNTLALESWQIQDIFGNFEVAWKRYEGEFVYGKKHGFGTLVFANQDKYVGNFVSDQMSGTGTLYKANGEVIFGDWKCNKLVESP